MRSGHASPVLAPLPALAISEAADGRRVLALSGRLEASTVRGVWAEGRKAIAEATGRRVVVDAANVDYCDGAGVAMLVNLMQQAGPGTVQVANLKPAFEALLQQFDPERLARDVDPPAPRRSAIEDIGIIAAGIWQDMRTQVAFIGETAAALVYAMRHPSTVRWKDVWAICERVGADALPIVALISFLLGVILAFESAIPMRRFGAEIFVADLIGISMLRELGGLMTAILLAGRSGAAFAAEIGTMKVNQEVDALTTMGLDPVRFLVTPRIIAALLMTPLLTIFADLIGLLGGALTLRTFSIPFVTFVHEVDAIVTFSDFMAGFVKSFVFALLIAGIGCLRGLQTRAGASSVGDAATRAVVSGIIMLVIIDGIFAVIYFFLDI
ncbi:MAG TPA: MlaE family lipid ABC transporter permease subunit [Casimicrobiaceae bacterium]|nr:MlaE family lipid ABC transporter permease subunit [Casimicrobiaceae bacterium]